MSLLHEKSVLALKSELDIFELPPTQTVIESSSYISFNPLTSSLNGPIEFLIPGSGEDYIDLNSILLQVKAKILKSDGSVLVEGVDKVHPINYLLHSLWSQVDVFLNDKLVSVSNNLYPYKSIFEALLSVSENVQKTTLSTAFFEKNKETLQKRCEKSSEFELFGKLHADICFQSKLLLNGVDLKIRLTRSKNEFALMSLDENKKDYIVRILSATIFVRKMKVSPSVIIAHARILANDTAKYPIKRTDMKSYIIPRGLKQFSVDSLILGPLPSRILFAFVENDASLGNMNKNPFHFYHYFINFLALYVDGKMIPSLPFQPDFDKRLCTREYFSLIEGLGNADDKHHGLSLTYDEFIQGNTIFCFDLTPDNSASDNFEWSLIKNGNISLSLQFAKNLSHPVSLIVYAQYDALISIDNSKTVEIEF